MSNRSVTIAELVQQFPGAFSTEPAKVRPLKLGIRDDLYQQSVISHRRITAALRSYCNRVQYLKATMEGAVRIDLAGKPAGTVTAAEAEHAMQKLTALAAAVAAKRTTKAPSSVTADEALHAASRPADLHEAPAKRASKVASASKGTPRPKEAGNGKPAAAAQKMGPRRLGLADLKAASAMRKAAR